MSCRATRFCRCLLYALTNDEVQGSQAEKDPCSFGRHQAMRRSDKQFKPKEAYRLLASFVSHIQLWLR